mmetsp:Transcript_3876/g.8149  ORF Transcript_3876/g.8149 Transcript_3876/m.8149 type:complete len:241 (-) Transcript_3876:574-1296(-)
MRRRAPPPGRAGAWRGGRGAAGPGPAPVPILPPSAATRVHAERPGAVRRRRCAAPLPHARGRPRGGRRAPSVRGRRGTTGRHPGRSSRTAGPGRRRGRARSSIFLRGPGRGRGASSRGSGRQPARSPRAPPHRTSAEWSRGEIQKFRSAAASTERTRSAVSPRATIRTRPPPRHLPIPRRTGRQGRIAAHQARLRCPLIRRGHACGGKRRERNRGEKPAPREGVRSGRLHTSFEPCPDPH